MDNFTIMVVDEENKIRKTRTEQKEIKESTPFLYKTGKKKVRRRRVECFVDDTGGGGGGEFIRGGEIWYTLEIAEVEVFRRWKQEEPAHPIQSKRRGPPFSTCCSSHG